MMKNTIVIITGSSASGKTTLGQKLSSEFKMVLLSKGRFSCFLGKVEGRTT